MREYDDDIRVYTPVLQRIIILVAVIIAVPVVLWTITSFVRTYVGPPQVPTFQRMTALQPSDGVADTASSNSTPNPGTISAPSVASIPVPAPPPADQTQIANPPSAAPQMTIATAGQPAGAAPAPTQPIPAQAAPAPPMAAAPASAGNVSAPSDRTIVWPNPTAPTATSMAAPSAAADAQQPASSNDTSDALPAVPPMRGPVPLPRRRPNVVAMMEPAQTGAPPVGASPAVVPLPRARPTDAPAAPPDTTTNDVPSFARDAVH